MMLMFLGHFKSTLLLVIIGLQVTCDELGFMLLHFEI